MEDEELPFVALSDLGCLRLDWPRALFTFMARYQFEEGMRGAVWLHTVWSLYYLWEAYSAESGQTCRHIPHGVGAVVAMLGDVVHGLERYISGLCRSHEKSS